MNISDIDLGSIDLDSVRRCIKAASRASYPELTLEHSEWERLVRAGQTHTPVEAPGVQWKALNATRHLALAMQALEHVPNYLAALLLRVAMSDQ